jgi:hypothetical protein
MCFRGIPLIGDIFGGILGGGDPPAPVFVPAPPPPPVPVETPAERAARQAEEAARAAEARRQAEFETERERERIAQLDEEERRKAAERLALNRFSFGELNRTGPFGLAGTDVSLFRPIAAASRRLGE